MTRALAPLALALLAVARVAGGQARARPAPADSAPSATRDSVTLRIVGVDLRTAVQIMQQYLDRPVIFSGSPGASVTLETPRPVPRSNVPRLLRGLLESQGYELVDDSASAAYRARPRETPRPSAAPLPQQPGLGAAGDAHRQAAAAPELFVIALRHARAADVASMINALFGHLGPSAPGVPGAPRGFPSPTLGDQLREMQLPAAAPPPPSPEAIPGTGGRPATLSGELTIVPDPRANSLLVRATRADFELIRAAVEQIDVRPAQVLIEVLIVEARRDRNFRLNLAASLTDAKIKNTENTKVSGTFSPAGAGLGDFTLEVMGAGGSNLDATIAAAAGRGDVRIVSRPVVLTANDEQAEVVVGSQRPFVQVSRALPTEDAVRDQIVQYRDVGTKLSVRPTISIDGTVQLSVTQEVSNATTETAFNAPVISTRSIRTDLLVRDSQTIVLGGLTDREHDVNSSGIPILSSIPFLGGLFGSHERTSAETELFIFLTPRVIRTDDDAKRLTDPLHERARRIQP